MVEQIYQVLKLWTNEIGIVRLPLGTFYPFIPYTNLYNVSIIILPKPSDYIKPVLWVHRASANGHARMAKLLLDLGSSSAAVDRFGWTPLHFACWYNRLEAVRCLVASRANVLAPSNLGYFPIKLARERGHRDVEKFLRENSPIAASMHGKKFE